MSKDVVELTFKRPWGPKFSLQYHEPFNANEPDHHLITTGIWYNLLPKPDTVTKSFSVVARRRRQPLKLRCGDKIYENVLHT